MALQGIVTPLCNPLNGAVIDPAWAQMIRGISPGLSFARSPVGGDRSGHVPLDLHSQGAAALQAVGFDVWGILEDSLGPPDLNPNDGLGYMGNPFLNEWIHHWTLDCCSLMPKLGFKTFWAGNEPNLQASANLDEHGKAIPVLKTGQVADVRKPSAKSPSVYFSALYQLCLRAQVLAPGVTIIPASLSIMSKFKTGQYDAWVGGYIDEGMEYLTSNGAKPDPKTGKWPWSGLSANMEGDPDLAYMQYTIYGMSQHKKQHDIAGPTYVGEWSSPNGGLNVPVMRGTFDALDSTVYAMAFFQANSAVPGDETTYGCFDYTYQKGLFVARDKMKWYDTLGTFIDSRQLTTLVQP